MATLSDQRLGGGDDLHEFGLQGQDAIEDGVEVLGAFEIVPADDERGAVRAQFLHLRRLHVLGGLQLDVDEVDAGGGGFREDFELGGDGALEFAAGRGAAAGGDGGDLAALVKKLLEPGKDGGGIGQIVEAKFDEVIFADNALGVLEHFGGRDAGDGDADFANAGADVVGGERGVFDDGIPVAGGRGSLLSWRNRTGREGLLGLGFAAVAWGCAARDRGCCFHTRN